MLHFSGKGQSNKDGIFYSSLNYSVRLGQLEGTATLKELKQHGDFGVGGQNGLASEMVFLNGVAYRFPANGKGELMPDTAKFGFAAVKFCLTSFNDPLYVVTFASHLGYNRIKVNGRHLFQWNSPCF